MVTTPPSWTAEELAQACLDACPMIPSPVGTIDAKLEAAAGFIRHAAEQVREAEARWDAMKAGMERHEGKHKRTTIAACVQWILAEMARLEGKRP